MIVFVDTSAWFAALASNDDRHAEATLRFAKLGRSADHLVTHNYVVIESIALMSSRLGKLHAARFISDVLPVAVIEWIQPSLHEVAQHAYLASHSSASFVDHVSFALMRTRGMTRAFAFDDDFARQGFDLV